MPSPPTGSEPQAKPIFTAKAAKGAKKNKRKKENGKMVINLFLCVLGGGNRLWLRLCRLGLLKEVRNNDGRHHRALQCRVIDISLAFPRRTVDSW
jgi:hypothetical protein